MGERCTLSGHIQQPWYYRGLESNIKLRNLYENNKRIISELPDDEDFPPLIKSMFFFSASLQEGYDISMYRGPVIFFGGSFNKLYLGLDQWLEKFENLLRQLYWEHASIILVTEIMGRYNYHWEATDEAFEKLTILPPVPIQDWVFEGEPRSFI
jgi:hypothetical protein